MREERPRWTPRRHEPRSRPGSSPAGSSRSGVTWPRPLRRDSPRRSRRAVCGPWVELTLNDPEVDALHAIEVVAGVAPWTRARHRRRDGALHRVRPACARRRRDVPCLPAPGRGVGRLGGGAWRSDRPGLRDADRGPRCVAGGRGRGQAVSRVRRRPRVRPRAAWPVPGHPLVPTGGVTLESAATFIAAGAVAVGMGGWLFGKGATDGIRERARQVVDAVAVARPESRGDRSRHPRRVPRRLHRLDARSARRGDDVRAVRSRRRGERRSRAGAARSSGDVRRACRADGFGEASSSPPEGKASTAAR